MVIILQMPPEKKIMQENKTLYGGTTSIPAEGLGTLSKGINVLEFITDFRKVKTKLVK